MARVDRLKEEIGWLKLVFGALIAIDATLLGWLAQNVVIVALVALVGALLFVVRDAARLGGGPPPRK